MPWYRIRVAGRPLHTLVDGVPRLFGFFVNRIVHASTARLAQEEAYRVVAAEAGRRSIPDAPPPRLAVDDLVEVGWWAGLLARKQGFVLFPLPQDEAGVPDGSEATSWLGYDEARFRLAELLRRDAFLQESGQAAAIGAGYEEIDGRLPRGQGAEWTKVFVALGLWDYWIDARNHQWARFYEIGEQEWPLLGRAVAEDLAADREVSNLRVLNLVS